jgi:hypothetical protein
MATFELLPLGLLRLRPLELENQNHGTKPSDPLESTFLIFLSFQKGEVRRFEAGWTGSQTGCRHDAALGRRIQKSKIYGTKPKLC